MMKGAGRCLITLFIFLGATWISVAQVPVVRDSVLLDSVISIGSQRSAFRENVDWEELIPRMKNVYDTAGLIPAAQLMLQELKDFHGAVIYQGVTYQGCTKEWVGTKMETDIALFAEARSGTMPVHAEILPGQVGYLRLPGVQMGEKEFDYVKEVRKAIIDIRSRVKTKGWIIDLRLNGGGTMYPMFAGLAGFFGSDTLGYFTGSSPEYPVGLQNGAYNLSIIQNGKMLFNSKLTLIH
jgi:hypothetical protein